MNTEYKSRRQCEKETNLSYHESTEHLEKTKEVGRNAIEANNR